MKQASSAIGFASGNSSIIRFGAILLVMGLSELASANTWDNHWAFREISNPTPPTISGAANPVDSFFGIPEEKASRRNLLRRAYLDLVGLPPSYEEIEQFISTSYSNFESSEPTPGPHCSSSNSAKPRDQTPFPEKSIASWLPLPTARDKLGDG